ncbi:glycosyltransferase, partial [Streptomyces galilaeus]
TNINYRYSLPNKIFDYVAAGVPVLASPLTEIAAFIHKYKVGVCIESHEPQHIAGMMNYMLNVPEYSQWKANTRIASEENSWENERKIWLEMIQKIK